MIYVLMPVSIILIFQLILFSMLLSYGVNSWRWQLYLWPHMLIVILRYPLSPIAVKWFSTKDKLNLTFPFMWLQTIDNPSTGDEGHQKRIKGTPLGFWNRVRWFWRNGGSEANHRWLGVKNDRVWLCLNYLKQDSKNLWIRPDGSWQFRARVPVFGRVWTPYIGWALFGAKEDLCSFKATIFRLNKIV